MLTAKTLPSFGLDSEAGTGTMVESGETSQPSLYLHSLYAPSPYACSAKEKFEFNITNKAQIRLNKIPIFKN